LDGDSACLGRGLLRQYQFEHAVGVFGAYLRFIDFLRQLEAARNLAEIALGTQHAFAFPDILLLAPLGADRDDGAIDGDMDVLLFYARNFGMDQIALFLFLDVDFYRRCVGLRSKINRADEKTTENKVSVKANASPIGVKRSGRN